MTQIYGFGHKRLSGKSTAGTVLKQLLTMLNPNQAIILGAFADPLKKGIGEGVFGLSNSQLDGPEKERIDQYWDMTPRQILQTCGQALREAVVQDLWVKAKMRKVDKHIANGSIYVITDVRYPNEADAVLARGGKLIRVDRAVDRSTTADQHTSETALDGYDKWTCSVDNNGSLTDLRKQLMRILLEGA